ncbi:MAG: radical SAM protein [Elusimicrobia bacterium]|nr:radical SAM protein [Elusimicrobiota bacterium]
MRILFLDPPSPPGFVSFKHAHGGFGEFCHESRLKTPTLDLFHAAAWAERSGAEVRVQDSVLLDHTPTEAVAAARSRQADLVALRVGSGSAPHDLALAVRLRGALRVPVVLFGPQAAHEREAAFAAGLDAVVVGEAPPVFGDLARLGRLKAVDGLALPGRPLPAPRFADVDLLPPPRWDMAPWRRYSYLTAQTAWGCPVGCSYCPYPVTQGRAVRARPLASVVEEFRSLRRLRAPFVLCRDPFFTIDRDRTLALCAALEAAGSPVLWGCETRLEALDAELVAAMARAGCIRVEFGVESVSARVLRSAGRSPLAPERIREQVALLKRHGMLTYALYMLGLPGETEAEARATMDFALSLGTNAASFSCASPFPGTALETFARRRGLVPGGRALRLTASVPSMPSGPLSTAAVGRLRQEARALWKRSKQSALPASLTSAPR